MADESIKLAIPAKRRPFRILKTLPFLNLIQLIK